jgi:hypothetical protein
MNAIIMEKALARDTEADMIPANLEMPEKEPPK